MRNFSPAKKVKKVGQKSKTVLLDSTSLVLVFEEEPASKKGKLARYERSVKSLGPSAKMVIA